MKIEPTLGKMEKPNSVIAASNDTQLMEPRERVLSKNDENTSAVDGLTSKLCVIGTDASATQAAAGASISYVDE